MRFWGFILLHNLQIYRIMRTYFLAFSAKIAFSVTGESSEWLIQEPDLYWTDIFTFPACFSSNASNGISGKCNYSIFRDYFGESSPWTQIPTIKSGIMNA